MWLPTISFVLFSLHIFTVIGAASSWGFRDASVSIQSKGAGVGGGFREALKPSGPLSRPVSLASSDTLKILLTTAEDGKPKRPHQAFLSFKDVASGLQVSYPFDVRDSSKAKIELTAKDLPAQLWYSAKPLRATVTIASFGNSQPYNGHVFDIDLKVDSSAPVTVPKKPLRYGKLEQIHHIFRPDPKSPPKIVTLVFTGAVLATLPVLLGTWISLGANLNHLPHALGRAPLAHVSFFGSVVALEGIFFMYYTRWNLFQTLPAALAVGSVAFLSGSRALSEVQERRLAGQR